jgi:hypothetical protein
MATKAIAALDQLRSTLARISAGQLNANVMATAPATAAHMSDVIGSEPFAQPYCRLMPPLAVMKIPAAQ